MISNKKVKKLFRDPQLFFSDMYFKHSNRLKKHLPVKHQGNHQFTVIAAVYNVEKYLNEFFESLVKQSLDFKKHIQIICVDDGSKDNSATIIKKWQKKYPKNIHYIYKENGGQASARNLGIKETKTEWVTFIDPDDFVSNDYFYKIDTFLTKEKQVSLVGLPLIFYFEDKKIFKDSHPLKYRFAKGDTVFSIDDLGEQLQLSASTAIFRTNNIINNNIIFDEKMKPSFEDAKFVSDYILQSNKPSQVGFVSGVSYFYRKRSDGSSTLDGAWKNPLLFSRVLSDGCIAILKKAEKKFGYVPKHIQRIALYHIIWYFGRIVNNSSSLSHLTEEQRKQFVDLVFEMFSYIDEKTIIEFNLGGTWFFQKVALLGLFKNQQPPYQIAYVEKYDLAKDQILVSYFSHFSVLEEWRLDGKEQLPAFQKTVKYEFLDLLYIREYKTWISCKNTKELELRLNNKAAKITFAGKQYNVLSIADVKAYFKNGSTIKSQDWILMDRDNQADDNAEHLYRYISKHYPQQSIYFALRKNSHDWDRLAKEGFNLLDFGSTEFENRLKNCAKIVSSHIDGYITHYFKDNSLLDKDYVFLQHGITKDDMSKWLNTKKMACFVTVTSPEYHSIAENDSPYKFGKKEVQLTGFPRYDSLLKNNNLNAKQILVMPTWRSTIVGAYISGTLRERNPNFMQTNYAKHWHKFMNNDYLENLHKQGYQIIFAPHPSVQEYMDEFTLPDYVKIYRYSQGKIQALFQESSLLITDYSSVAFDMAYLNKAIIYYQFDYKEVFSGSHTYQKGYFEYERDGFGEVVYDEKSLCNAIEKTLANKGKPLPIYGKRIKETFPFRDDQNCERVYQAIKALDEPESKKIDVDIAKNAIQTAFDHQAWHLLAERCQTFLTAMPKTEHTAWATEMWLNGLYHVHRFDEMENLLATLSNQEKATSWQAKMAFARQDWQQAVDLWQRFANLSTEQKLMKLQAYMELGYTQQAQALIADLQKSDHQLDEMQKNIVDFWQDFEQQDQKRDALDRFDDVLASCEKQKLRQYQPQLLLARYYRKAGLFDNAHRQLVNFEKHTTDDVNCRLEIAQLAFARKSYEKVISQLEKAFAGNMQNLPDNGIKIYLMSLEKNKQQEKIAPFLAKVLEMHPNDHYLLEKQLELHLREKNTPAVLEAFRRLWLVSGYVGIENFHNVIHSVQAERFAELLSGLEHNKAKSEERLYLSGKFAVACGDWEKAEQCLSKCRLKNTEDLLLMIKVYAEQQKAYRSTDAFKALSKRELSGGQRNLLDSFDALMRRDWLAFSDGLQVLAFTEKERIQYKPDLLRSRALRKQGNYKDAHQCLVQYEKIKFGDLMLRVAIARLAFANGNYVKCIDQLQKAFNNQSVAFTKEVASEYLHALKQEKRVDILDKIAPQFEKMFPNNLLQHSTAKQAITGNYQDTVGNKISAPNNLVNCHFQFLGKNNQIEIHSEQVNLRNVTIECRGDNNKIVIGKNVRMAGHWRLGYRCVLEIGQNSTSTNPVYMTIAEGTKVSIGEDCMFATNNQIRTDDAHPIYDAKNGKRVNRPKDIKIGNHVWVGYGATVLGGSVIGNGSVIGAYALAKSTVPNNSIAVGIPAKVVKKDIFWERDNLLNIDIDNGFSEDKLKAKWYAEKTMG